MTNTIGIDIGGTHIRAARVSAEGRILDQRKAKTTRQADVVLNDVIKMITALRDSETIAIGVGVPSRVDVKTGEIFAGGYVDLSGADFTDKLQKATSLATIARNDASMALVAEARLGAARSHANAILLTIGTGVGGAVLANGKISHGGGTGGQLGHITVRLDGKVCACGRTGCLETESSGTALGFYIKAADLSNDTKIEDLLNNKSREAEAVVAAWAKPLRAGIDSLVAAFGPDIILLGGGLGGSAVKAVARFPAASSWFQCPIAAAELGDEAGVIGAALAALEEPT
jgi:glucokinase